MLCPYSFTRKWFARTVAQEGGKYNPVIAMDFPSKPVDRPAFILLYYWQRSRLYPGFPLLVAKEYTRLPRPPVPLCCPWRIAVHPLLHFLLIVALLGGSIPPAADAPAWWEAAPTR